MSRTAQIDVEYVSDNIYDVTIDNFTSARSVYVTLGDETYHRLAQGRTKEQLIRDAVRFLLTREPKENLLDRFDVEDITKYYSDFEQVILGG